MRRTLQTRPATGLPRTSWWLPGPSFAPRYSKALAATAQLLNRPVSAIAGKYQCVDNANTECDQLMNLLCSLNPILVTCTSAIHWRDKAFPTFSTAQGAICLCHGSSPTSARSLLCRTFCSLSSMASGIVVTSFDRGAHFCLDRL